MAFDGNAIVAMGFGICSTVMIHLGKAMERHGIEVFDQIGAKLGKTKNEKVEKGLKKPTIYIIGAILNNIAFLWAIVGNLFAPPSYMTSMFGLGLIALLIYASRILHEKIQRIEYIGAVVLIIGTLILGMDGMIRPNMDMSQVNVPIALIFIGVFIIIGFIGIGFVVKQKSTTILGIVFGLVAGGCGGFDPVMKGIGQNFGTGSGYPTSWIGWLVFALSFLMGFFSFTITQWGFIRKANASTLVPCFNSNYVVLPVLIQTLTLPGFTIEPLTIIGLLITISGIVLMTAFKKTQK
jgi:drug/metabolite transporter (DMT)-like permease